MSVYLRCLQRLKQNNIRTVSSEALAKVDLCGPPFDMMQTSFFLSRQTLIASKVPGMAIWREKVFAWMLRNAANAMEFFKLPSNRVVELGSQVEI